MPKLLFESGEKKGEAYQLGEVTVIGRLSTNPISINDAMASREHTKITKESDGYYVVDLESRNGTLVNGEKITRRKLAPGDLITVGRTEMRFDEGDVRAEEKAVPSAEPAAEKEAAKVKTGEKAVGRKRGSAAPSTLSRVIFILLTAVFFVVLLLLSKWAGELLMTRITEKTKTPVEETQPKTPD